MCKQYCFLFEYIKFSRKAIGVMRKRKLYVVTDIEPYKYYHNP